MKDAKFPMGKADNNPKKEQSQGRSFLRPSKLTNQSLGVLALNKSPQSRHPQEHPRLQVLHDMAAPIHRVAEIVHLIKSI